MLSCCGKVFHYSFLFCRIYNVKEEEERGIRGREKKGNNNCTPKVVLTFGVQFINKYFQ